MNKLIKFFSIVVLSVGLLGGCASQVYHDYIMSGQVVTVDDKQAVVCVSDTDGLKEHQVFNVYRTVKSSPQPTVQYCMSVTVAIPSRPYPFDN